MELSWSCRVVVMLLRFAYTFAWLKTLVGEAFLFLAVPSLFVRWCRVCVFASFLPPFHFLLLFVVSCL